MDANKNIGYGRPPSKLQESTRETIIKFLKQHSVGTTQDFIEASGDSDNNVRRAIRFLDSKKIIASHSKRKSTGVGNPAKLWHLTTQ